jgi:anthranilate phosphoribosyltransferase
MSFAIHLKELVQPLGDAGDLAAEDAERVFGAMLDGGVPELELGALLAALRMKGESLSEFLGFYQALAERVHRLTAPENEVRTVVLGTYEGARAQANLTPLVALLLKRMRVPVIVHGTLEGNGYVASAYVFRELGVLPCATLAQAQDRLDREGLVFVPTSVLAPGLANLLALRNRLGVRNSAHVLVKLIDPLPGRSLRLVAMSDRTQLERVRELFLATGERAIVFRGANGEPFADPRQRPRIEYFDDGRAEVLFAEEHVSQEPLASYPDSANAKATALYIRKALDGAVPLPMPVVNEIACCLYGADVTADFNQAKAITAVQMHALTAA